MAEELNPDRLTIRRAHFDGSWIGIGGLQGGLPDWPARKPDGTLVKLDEDGRQELTYVIGDLLNLVKVRPYEPAKTAYAYGWFAVAM